MDKVHIFTAGGTIDKEYFDAKSDYQVGTPMIADVLKKAFVNLDYEITSILQKDSLEFTDTDRELIFKNINSCPGKFILITHGTDTMVETAQELSSIKDKVIVLTGALTPAKFADSDAPFNIGGAIGAVQSLSSGVYIFMNGKLYESGKVFKNRDKNRFEETS